MNAEPHQHDGCESDADMHPHIESIEGLIVFVSVVQAWVIHAKRSIYHLALQVELVAHRRSGSGGRRSYGGVAGLKLRSLLETDFHYVLLLLLHYDLLKGVGLCDLVSLLLLLQLENQRLVDALKGG